MDREKKRMIALGVIIVAVIIASVVYFFWGSVINRGTLRIIADPPFTVEIFGGKKFTCDKSPCEIKQKKGLKDLIIAKEGAKTILAESEIKLWQTVELEIDFDLIPTITTADSLPQVQEEAKYKLSIDKNGMQKLVDAADDRGRAIVYFSGPLKNPKAIGSKEFVLVIDEKAQEVYKIDIKAKTKEKITASDLQSIEGGEWSNSGEYFVFSKNDSIYLWILDKAGTTKQLSLIADRSQVAWTYNNGLMFVTDQSFSGDNPLDEKSGLGFSFGTYFAGKNEYKKIETFSEITEIPEEFVPTSNGKTIYFKSGDENFKIIL